MPMLKCHKCNNSWGQYLIYCGECGTKLNWPKPAKYGGVWDGQGIYRLTIIYEGVFRNEDHVNECVRKTYVGEEGYEPTKTKVTKVRSTCTKKTHPYFCTECLSQDGYNIYSDGTDVKCEWCDKDNTWEKR